MTLTTEQEKNLKEAKNNLMRFPLSSGINAAWLPAQIIAIWKAENFEELEQAIK